MVACVVYSFKTLGDFDVAGKRVLVRVDINSPLERMTLKVKDRSKIASAVPTLKELSDKGAKIAVLAHQGKKDHWEYTDLHEHAEILSVLLHRNVKYVDDLLGSVSKKAIESLKNGEIILLKNVRSYDEEDHRLSPEHHAEGALVKHLAPLFDLFVNDAAGRLMEKEIESLSRIVESPKRPCVVVFGGTKFADSIHVVNHLLEAGIADNIVIGGLVGLAYSAADGKHIGDENMKTLANELSPEHVAKAKRILSKFGSKITLPVDLALDKDGKRLEVTLDHDPPALHSLDIGSKTIESFGEILSHAKTVLISGPVGVFEKEEFAVGTRAIFEKSVSSGAYCIIGGGHTTAAANQMGFSERISYISSGGGALEHFLLGRPMAVIEALNQAALRK
jgi:phosphoglycerate kinase